LTGGHVHDAVVANALTEKVHGFHVLADKGYESDDFRETLKAHRNTVHIPPKSNAIDPKPYDKNLYRYRPRIENTFCKLKENKRIDTRFDKLDSTFMAFVSLALIKIVCKIVIC
jgi:transposase